MRPRPTAALVALALLSGAAAGPSPCPLAAPEVPRLEHVLLRAGDSEGFRFLPGFDEDAGSLQVLVTPACPRRGSPEWTSWHSGAEARP